MNIQIPLFGLDDALATIPIIHKRYLKCCILQRRLFSMRRLDIFPLIVLEQQSCREQVQLGELGWWFLHDGSDFIQLK